MAEIIQKQKKFRNNYLFEYLKNILTTKSNEVFQKHLQDDFEASYQPYMINSYLSMSPNDQVRQVIFDNQIYLDHMDKKTHYMTLIKMIPKQNSSFIRYIK